MRSLLIVLCLGALAAPSDAAPNRMRVVRPKVVKKAKPRIRLEARQVQRPLNTRQPKTEVKHYQMGEGRGHTLVFLHGLGGEPGGPMMDGVFKAMQAQGLSATVHAPLLREVRRSDTGKIVSESRQTMTEQLRHARGVIDAQPGKVILFGHSFGAKAALILAREYPDKVKAIIAVAPSVKMLHAYWKSISGERGLADGAQMQAVFAQRQRSLESRIAATKDPELRQNLAENLNYHKIMRDMIGHSESTFEQGVRVPTIVFHGSQDLAVSKHYVKRFAEDNRKVNLVTYPHHDHHLVGPSPKTTREVRQDVGRRVVDFIDQLAPQ